MMCPLRAKEFTTNMSDQECQPNCAWFMTDYTELDTHACAIAVIAALVGVQPHDERNNWVIENEVCND